MFRSLTHVIAGDRASRRTRRVADRRRRAGPALEWLEGRQLMTVTNFGGALLPHVEVQGLYYGSDWGSDPVYLNVKNNLEGFLKNIVNSSYMDMLTEDGYGVGRGTADGGSIYATNVNKAQYLTDGQVQSTIQGSIKSGALKSPNANSLYVVYVEPNVAVSLAKGNNSQTNLYGYHGAFGGTDASGHPADIHYALITYPGGLVGNKSLSWTGPFDQLTLVTSHELAEAVTDPNVDYKTKGWFDTEKGEVGDIVVGQTVYLSGYAVQRIADKNDQAMTPAGATAATQESFFLQTSGQLYKVSANGQTFITSGIASLSDQAIDNYGQVMVDVVTTLGDAYEYHEGSGLTYLAGGVKSAKAGEGVSYVLFKDGHVQEYTDVDGHWSRSIDSSVSSIDAGTDRIGVNMVDVIEAWSGDAFEDSDSSGGYWLGSSVQSVSAGQLGYSSYVTTTGKAYLHSEAVGSTAFLASNVAQVTTGTDQYGDYMIELLYNSGDLWEYRVPVVPDAGNGWSFLDSGVTSVAKGHAGFVALVLSSGQAWGHDTTWHFLGLNALTVA
jgi:hypothetical protein